VSTWFVPSSGLTPDQQRAVELDPREHRLILGAPGSGKTLVLLHRARHLMDRFGVTPERLRFFVFTNTLKEYIGSALRYLDLPLACVTTFDGWCMRLHRAHIDGPFPRTQTGGPDFDAIRSAVLAVMKESPNAFRMFDMAMVDEGQDLTRESFEILKIASAHVTVCMDYNQQLYEKRCDENSILRALGLRQRNLALLAAYRCCPYITKLAAHLTSDTTFLPQIKQSERLTPLFFLAASVKDEQEKIVEVVRGRMLMGERIGILVSNNAKVFSLANVLQNAGVEVEVHDRKPNSNYRSLDFESDRPKILTYHGAKGLPFDTVLLPRWGRPAFVQPSKEQLRKLLFVGITRASNWAFLSGVEGQIPGIVNEIMEMERLKIISVMKSSRIQPTLFDFMEARQDEGDEIPSLPQGTEDDLTSLF
jgi:superfamily I DNA/RNA helicase